MKIKIKPLTLYKIVFYTLLVFFVALLIIDIVSIFVNRMYGDATQAIDLISTIVLIVLGAGTLFSFVAMINQKRFIEQLKLENSYTLGHPTSFYNLPAFKNRASKMSRAVSLSKLNQYVIVFSAASQETSINSFQNEGMTTLNYKVSLFLADLFENGKGRLSSKYNIFGFNRGIFLIYTFSGDEQSIREIVNLITNAIFRIVKEENLKIWAQPFFGVREVEPGENLTSAIEDALMARNAGEANFESYTIFNKKVQSDDSSIYIKELEYALKNDEFVPYYQPKFNLKRKEFVGCEVLARWNSPNRGLLSPAIFIDKAEQFGLLSAIDLKIFEKALADIRDTLKRGRRAIPVSCNFSLYEFFSHTFLDTITNLLQEYQVPPSLVEIEITETTSQVNQFLSVSVIKKLKDYGIRVLMDDYGVGYSQIQNLKNIPFDAIKIDKSFADVMLTDEKTNSIMKFLVELGHVNDLEVIVEGVEKQEQIDALAKMDVDTIQGYYYSKPLAFKDYEEFLRNNPFENGGNE